jgi:hypothetical protein
MVTKRSEAGLAAGLTAVAALLGACGGGTKNVVGGTCAEVQPCGGSLPGTWTIQAICETPTSFTGGLECSAAMIDGSMRVTSGTIAFNDDMTYSLSSQEYGTLKFQIPLPCSQSVDCNSYAALIQPRPPKAMTACATVNGICDCTLTFNVPLDRNDDGTYSTSGDALTLTSSSGRPVFADRYCVQENELDLLLTYPGTTMIGMRIVATK